MDPAHIRRVDRSFTENEYAVLVAHFLRLVHPLNSFVIPKQDYVAYDGKNLGEEQELINIVQDYVKAGFPLIIIATVVSMIILPIVFPFFP